MNVQSVSICVPACCPNDCKFCVSKLHTNPYKNLYKKDMTSYQINLSNRLKYAKENGVNCVILTGTGEPLMNMDYISYFTGVNMKIDSPFRHIELQTSGISLDEEKLEKLQFYNINTISLSISSLNSKKNQDYNGINDIYYFNITELCKNIKSWGFNLRLSLNLTDDFENFDSISSLFGYLKESGADQITFRKLYKNSNMPASKVNSWIAQHRCKDEIVNLIEEYIRLRGTALYKLSFGATKYDVHGMSVVLDDDCMNTETKNDLKYFIIREDGKLYTHWDKKGSLIY